jgi:hypothetical protein
VMCRRWHHSSKKLRWHVSEKLTTQRKFGNRMITTRFRHGGRWKVVIGE